MLFRLLTVRRPGCFKVIYLLEHLLLRECYTWNVGYTNDFRLNSAVLFDRLWIQ